MSASTLIKSMTIVMLFLLALLASYLFTGPLQFVVGVTTGAWAMYLALETWDEED